MRKRHKNESVFKKCVMTDFILFFLKKIFLFKEVVEKHKM